jgi:hypothetical protein
VRTTGALYAVDQEDLLGRLVFAEFVSGPLLPKASFRELPNRAGNLNNLREKNISFLV